MSYVDEIINEVQEMTPDEGFNVCRFEEHGADRLTLLAHFGTFEEAKDFAESIESDDIIYIYGNNEAGEAKYSSVKNHNIDTYLKMAEDDYFEDKHTPNEEYEKTNWFGHESSLFLNSVCKQCGESDFSTVEKDGMIKIVKCKNCGAVAYGRESAGESESSPYGIQNMLDDIVKKSLNRGEQKEIKEKMNDGFSLDALLEMVAEKLAKKAGKKLGLESKAIELDNKTCPHCDGSKKEPDSEDDCFVCGGTGKVDISDKTQGVESVNSWWNSLTDHARNKLIDQYGLLTGMEDGTDYSELSRDAQDKVFEIYQSGWAGEGGRGSGILGHRSWMLGTELGEECPKCMMATERVGGKCSICGE